MNYPDFAARFRQACREAQAPQTLEALGRWLGVSKAMAWNYRTGEKLPSMDKAIEIATKFNVCVEWLLTGRGPQRPPPPPDAVLDISDLPDAQQDGLRALVESMKSRAPGRDAA